MVLSTLYQKAGLELRTKPVEATENRSNEHYQWGLVVNVSIHLRAYSMAPFLKNLRDSHPEKTPVMTW
jgi:hypothetical protein